MVINLSLAVLLAATGMVAAKPELVPEDALKPSLQHQQAVLIVGKVLERYHYRKHKLDDAMSAKILDGYLEALDPNRSFFLQSDIDGFRNSYATRLDDDLHKAELGGAFDVFRTFRARVESATTEALALLDSDFDYSRDELYDLDREKAPWSASLAERTELWRKRVKNDTLSLRLTGKADEDIRDTLRTRYEGIARRTQQVDADDVFQTFLNAYAGVLEPHTGYMLPHNAENFDISMRLSLEGIGAVLRSEDEYTEIQEVVKGGPADLSGFLHAGDRIVGVAQSKDGEIVDVVGWRLQDVVDLIRGPKDSVVRLSVLPSSKGATATAQEVVIVRDKIKLEEQAAKKSIIEGIDGLSGKRIGVVEIPAFYRDFRGASRGDKDFRSTTRDVRQLLAELRDAKVSTASSSTCATMAVAR